MKTGRRTANPDTKQMMGTYRGDRHGDIAEIATPPKSVPVPPAYLTKEAMMVWREEHPRVVACGAVEADSSIFGRYCIAEATFRGMAAQAEPISAALMTELRRTAELLGIAGQRSRLARIKSDDAPTASKFGLRPN